MSFRPTVDEERWQAVASLAGASDLTRARDGGWRTFNLLPRIGFFILGCILAAALWGFLALASDRHEKAAAVVAGVICIGVAEIMITWAKWFHAGLEEALHCCGLVMIAAPMVIDENESTILTALAIVAAVAAFRLLNPLALVAGVACLAATLPEPLRPWLCDAAAIVSLAVIVRDFKRPSHQQMVAALVITMPIAAYFFAKDGRFELAWRVAVALLAYVIAALIAGVRFRLHAPLLAVFAALGVFAYEVRELSGLRLEARLIIWGAVLLVVALLLERRLRRPWHGITSEKLRDDNVFGLLELAGAAVLTPHEKPQESPAQLQAGGGAFGGGGASGDI